MAENVYTGGSTLKLKPGAAVVLPRQENFAPQNTSLSYVAFSNCGEFTYDLNAISDTVVNVTHGNVAESGVILLAAGYDSHMKLLGTDEIPVYANQENYSYDLPLNSAIKKFFLFANDGTLKPLSYADVY